MNVFTAISRLALVGKQFAAAGLNLEEFIASGDESALKAHLATLAPAAADTSAKDTEIARLTASAAAINASHAQLTAALASAGVAVTASDPKKGVQASDYAAALEKRIAVKAAELTAALGTRPIEAQVTNDPASAPKAAAAPAPLFGLARVKAAFAAESSRAAAARN